MTPCQGAKRATGPALLGICYGCDSFDPRRRYRDQPPGFVDAEGVAVCPERAAHLHALRASSASASSSAAAAVNAPTSSRRTASAAQY